ncbi:helix-turn-helix domain-containing protein [Brucella intermedia]|uniref:helix-turn-helix domain-containing protein n=1 Tax=Brucella intermedia TaxID=94625 RepID=UPI00124D8483|nr:helix-turn-helix transcriptional regulator [Brucella intermedia]KAB2729402.1 helix-turn-helix transcriptional regulator [Brucella intermedia]
MSYINQISGKQLAAARALLGIGQVELSAMSGISAPTLRRMESSFAPIPGVTNNVRAVVSKLEDLGIEFIGGSGVNLKFVQPTFDVFERHT